MSADERSSAIPQEAAIQQDVTGDQNQTIGQVLGGIVVYVSGGQAIINAPSEKEADESASGKKLSPNPYKGLLAFKEQDSDRYFGRTREIDALWSRFQDLHRQDSAVRILPIYGPSGSGKSSLVRAGLIPALNKQPLATQERARIAVLVPGDDPLYSLAMVLAKIVTNDLNPVLKADEFKQVLSKEDGGKYSGLKRIAYGLPEIATFPLIVLVDQFEETYSLCKDLKARDAFIGNLLYAASDRTQYVSVIVTMRSDFLGGTHKHPDLNRLFSTQGYLVPTMDQLALREAIANPAEAAGQALDEATIQQLTEQTVGREGALPLLQFSLTRIWEGIEKGQAPGKTLVEIGGVGGALAKEAQRVYDGLSQPQQEIAQRLFIGLVQLGDGNQVTRRRVKISNLITRSDNVEQFRQVVWYFAASDVRLITVSAEGNEETAEVTHEALFAHWQQLKTWLDHNQDDIRFQRRLEEAAQYWQAQKRPAGLLWQRPDLDLLRSYHKRLNQQMTTLQLDFFQQAVRRETRQTLFRWGTVGALAIFALAMAWLWFQTRLSEQRALARQRAAQAEKLLNQISPTQNEAGALIAVKSFEPLQKWQKATMQQHAIFCN